MIDKFDLKIKNKHFECENKGLCHPEQTLLMLTNLKGQQRTLKPYTQLIVVVCV